jgi:hypothetical protein
VQLRTVMQSNQKRATEQASRQRGAWESAVREGRCVDGAAFGGSSRFNAASSYADSDSDSDDNIHGCIHTPTVAPCDAVTP